MTFRLALMRLIDKNEEQQMKCLSKAQEEEKAQHVQAVNAKYEALEKAIEQYNTTVATEREKVEAALADLNATIETADGLRQEVAAAQEDYFDNHTEKWQESEAGQNYASWKEEWENELPTVEIDWPEELEVPDFEVADFLENLADEPF